MTKKKMPKKAPTKQTKITGTSTPFKRIKSISKVAEEYEELRDERMALGKREVEKRKILEGLMAKHSIDVYDDPDLGFTVSLEAGDIKAKVKRKNKDD